MESVLMHEALQRAARRFGDRHALRSGDGHRSFRDLDDMSNALARHLAAAGVGAGDRVAVMMANRMEFIVAVLAASKLGPRSSTPSA
jgi:long-chain acyl-CoA synthetase